jgi:hypothetical protein
MRMTRRKSMKSINTSTCNQQPRRGRRGSDQDQKEDGKEEEEVDRIDINNSTMCSVRTHEILRDTMYPESISVERSDSYIKGERIEQDLGSARKDTNGPKYVQVTLTGIMRQTHCRLISRTSSLTLSHHYSDLSLSTSQVMWPPATRGRRGQPPGGAAASHRIREPYTPKGFWTPPRTPLPASLVKPGIKGKLARRVNRQGYVELTEQFGERRLNSRTLSGNKYSYK